MKTYESSLYQKLNTVADWILRLVLINILIILFSLPIVTMYPALLAGYKLFTHYLNKREVPIIKGFWNFFKEDFGKKLQLGFLLAGAMVIGIINMTIYTDYLNLNSDIFSLIGYYVMIILVVAAGFTMLYTLPIMITYPKTETWLIIKFAFFLSGKYILRTVLAVLILLVPFALLLTPITIVFFVIAGISIPMLLYALLFKKVTLFIESLDKKND